MNAFENTTGRPPEEETMSDQVLLRQSTRRDFLKIGGLGVVGLVGGGALAAVAQGGSSDAGSLAAHITPSLKRRVASTDGFITLPGRPDPYDLYVFGFKEVGFSDSLSAVVNAAKGKAQVPSPILAVTENTGFQLNLTNVGFTGRPDLDDSHTIHWHGFRDAIPIFDGTPELSIAVGVNRTFPYFYVSHHPGTYIYHCHFEDSEHVQMGMTGIVFVRPAMGPKFVFNDATTAFDREFSLLLNEVDVRAHDGLIAIQEFVWSEYRPQYWIINGRSYPHTVEPNKGEPGADPDLDNQPISSLIQVRGGDRALLRVSNLGYEQHSMVLQGIEMEVVGEDATPLGALSYSTNTLYIGPGESREVLFTAPAFDASSASGASTYGPWNTYFFKNRNYDRQTNGGAPGLGGMVTEVRVFDPSNVPALPLQGPNDLNKTYA